MSGMQQHGDDIGIVGILGLTTPEMPCPHGGVANSEMIDGNMDTCMHNGITVLDTIPSTITVNFTDVATLATFPFADVTALATFTFAQVTAPSTFTFAGLTAPATFAFVGVTAPATFTFAEMSGRRRRPVRIIWVMMIEVLVLVLVCVMTVKQLVNIQRAERGIEKIDHILA